MTNDNQFNNFVSVVSLTFPSRVQKDLWYQKYITFYSSNAVQYLRENGQLSQSASLVNEDNDLLRVSLIYGYKNKKAHEACQKLHGQWTKIAGEYIGKASGYRGVQKWGFS